MSTGSIDVLWASAGIGCAATGMVNAAGCWARPTRWTAVLITAFAVASVLTQEAGYAGLFERLVAATGAATLAVLAIGILRRTRGTS